MASGFEADFTVAIVELCREDKALHRLRVTYRRVAGEIGWFSHQDIAGGRHRRSRRRNRANDRAGLPAPLRETRSDARCAIVG